MSKDLRFNKEYPVTSDISADEDPLQLYISSKTEGRNQSKAKFWSRENDICRAKNAI